LIAIAPELGGTDARRIRLQGTQAQALSRSASLVRGLRNNIAVHFRTFKSHL
jgi:hypothetical protein